MPISFDPAGLRQHDQSTWSDPSTGDRISVHHFDQVPDLPAGLDELPRLRHELALLTGEWGCLLEAHVVSLGSVPALLQVLKMPLSDQPSGQVFIATLTVPKARSSAVLRIQCAESGAAGTREATLMTQLEPQNRVYPHPYAPELTGRLSYHAGDDARWDAQFPDHPLSRVRAWAEHVVRTASVHPDFDALPSFQPRSTQQASPAPARQSEYQESAALPAFPAPRNPIDQPPTPESEPARSAPVPPPGLQEGSTLTTVLPGIPIGGCLPLWTSDQGPTYWRMPDPHAVLAKLGMGSLARSPVDDDWVRDIVLLNEDDSTVLLADRDRSEGGGVAGEVVELVQVTEEEAASTVTQDSLVNVGRWLGEVTVSAAERNEMVMVHPGYPTRNGRPRVTLVVSDDKSIVTASPVPVGAPIWGDGIPEDYEPSETGEDPMIGPATPESIRAGGQLAMLAVGTWKEHPLMLCLSFSKAGG